MTAAPTLTPYQRERCEWLAVHLKREFNAEYMPVRVVRMKDVEPSVLVILPEETPT